MDQIVGYYGSWKVYSTCKIEDINPNLFTILIYAFAGLNLDGSIKVLDNWSDIELQGYKKFNNLKQQNPNLKTLLSVGGWNEGSANYSNMVSTQTSRRTFVNSCVSFIQMYGFDGIDFNWEYPSQRGGKSEDKENLSLLLKELRAEFNKHNYLLTMAVAAGETNIDISYQVPELSNCLDYILVMTYDMHSYTDGRTGVNAPLYSNDHLNVDYCVRAWIKRGANPSKLIMGIGAYGKSYTLANPLSYEIGAPTAGPGLPGPESQTAGILTFAEILALENSGWANQWSEEQQVPYSYHDNQWVGYDNIQSVKRKVSFAKNVSLGGVMIWSVDMDDPRGRQGKEFPIVTTINELIKN